MRTFSRSAPVVIVIVALVAFGTVLAPSLLLHHEHPGAQGDKHCLACRSALPSVGVLDLRLPCLAAPESSGAVFPDAVFALDEHQDDTAGARGPPCA